MCQWKITRPRVSETGLFDLEEFVFFFLKKAQCTVDRDGRLELKRTGGEYDQKHFEM